jgi:hypothetical protein
LQFQPVNSAVLAQPASAPHSMIAVNVLIVASLHLHLHGLKREAMRAEQHREHLGLEANRAIRC